MCVKKILFCFGCINETSKERDKKSGKSFAILFRCILYSSFEKKKKRNKASNAKPQCLTRIIYFAGVYPKAVIHKKKKKEKKNDFITNSVSILFNTKKKHCEKEKKKIRISPWGYTSFEGKKRGENAIRYRIHRLLFVTFLLSVHLFKKKCLVSPVPLPTTSFQSKRCEHKSMKEENGLVKVGLWTLLFLHKNGEKKNLFWRVESDSFNIFAQKERKKVVLKTHILLTCF